MPRRSVLCWCLALLAAGPAAFAQEADEGAWRAGAARVNITPERAMWMSGYGDRNRPAGRSGSPRTRLSTALAWISTPGIGSRGAKGVGKRS